MNGDLKVFLSEEQVQEIKESWAPFRNSPDSNWDLYWSSLRDRSESTGPYILSVYNENRLSGMLVGRVEKGQVILRVGYLLLLRLPVQKIIVSSIQTLLQEDNEELLRRMVSRVVGDLRRRLADVAVFDFIPEDSKIYQLLKEMKLPNRMRENVSERRIHWYLNLPASFNEYQHKHKGFMQKVRKFERAFEGRFQYRMFNGVDEIDEFCSAAEVVAQKTYQRALGVGFLNTQEDRGKMMAAATQGSWLAFLMLLDQKAVAFWSGCRFGTSVFLWWTAYDADYQEFSPGLVSFARMAECLIADGVTRIDFGGGDAAYKERLCTESQWEEKIYIYAPTVRGMVAKGVRSLDAALVNLTHTKLKALTNRLRTPLRRLITQRMIRRHDKSKAGRDMS